MNQLQSLVKLATSERVPPPLERGFQRACFDYALPTYVQDLEFQYLDWNAAFDELVAKPLGLRLGMHGMLLVSRLKNASEMMERSLKVFSSNFRPVVDNVLIIIDHPSFGPVELQRFATQIFDERGEPVSWAFTLNLRGAADVEAVYDGLMARYRKEVILSLMTSRLDLVFPHHADFRRLTETLRSQSTHPELFLGAHSIKLIEQAKSQPLILESNDQRLESLGKGLDPSVRIAKTFFDRLDDIQNGGFHRAILFDSLAVSPMHNKRSAT